MRKNKTKLQPATIGVFVILSLLLFMIAIVLFGGAKFFNKESLVIAYFDDSLKGLSVGAPVTYRGVTIGQVKEIKIQILGDGAQGHSVIIPIIIALDANQALIINTPDSPSEQDVADFLESMCKQGLRAKLKTISLVTGKRYIDLAIYQDSTPVFRDQSRKYIEIPTLPSDMHQMQKVLENMDLEKLYDKVLGTFDSLEQLTGTLAGTLTQDKTQTLLDDLLVATGNLNSILSRIDAGVDPLFTKANNELDKINTLTLHADDLMDSLETEIKPVATGITKTLRNLDNTLLTVDLLLKQAEQTLQPASPLYHRLSETLHQVEKTSGSIKKLSDFILRNPDALIFGLQQTGESHEQQ